MSKQCVDGGTPFCEITFSAAMIKHLILLRSHSCSEPVFQLDESTSSWIAKGGEGLFLAAMFENIKKKEKLQKQKFGIA